MQTTFTKEFMLKNGGCYLKTEGKIERLFFSNDNTEITFEDIINSNIPLKDKYWFFCKKVFTKEQNQQIAISVAEIVLPIYEKKYPENKAPREAINSAKLYITGYSSLEELVIRRYADAADDYAATLLNNLYNFISNEKRNF